MLTTTVPMPAGIEALPTDHIGRPIPWFVADLPDGTRDFRVASEDKQRDAIRFGLCWVCGMSRGRYGTFVIGTMCAVNRISAEPPAHLECATYSARVCPFLTTPSMVRRDRHLPEGITKPAGTMLLRNPEVAVVWTSRTWAPFQLPGGTLWNIGDPVSVEWYTHGRAATRSEVLAAIDRGLPALREVAERDGPRAVAELEQQHATALTLLPAS